MSLSLEDIFPSSIGQQCGLCNFSASMTGVRGITFSTPHTLWVVYKRSFIFVKLIRLSYIVLVFSHKTSVETRLSGEFLDTTYTVLGMAETFAGKSSKSAGYKLLDATRIQSDSGWVRVRGLLSGSSDRTRVWLSISVTSINRVHASLVRFCCPFIPHPSG